MKWKLNFILFFLVFTLCIVDVSIVFAQTTDNSNLPHTVYIQNRTLTLNTSLDSLEQYLQQASLSAPVLVYIQFGKSINTPKKDMPITFFKESYIGQNTFLCSVSGKLSEEALEPMGISGWAAVEPADKISGYFKTRQINPEQEISILILLKHQYDNGQLEKLVGKTGATMPLDQPWERYNVVIVQLLSKEISQWAASPWVLYIQPKLKPHKLNVMAEGYTNTEKAHQPVILGGYGLLGNGVTVGVGDDANPHHIDYIDRLTSFNPSAGNDHGNFTTGTVGGNGIVDQRYRGFAPEANLISDWFDQIITNAPIYTQNFDMVATNNSYALVVGNCNYAGTYDVYSEMLDKQADSLPHLLNCFAAGNDGALNCTPYTSGYGTVEGAYQTAKNVLTVGAIGKTRDIEYYKFSRGPVKDGRLKPEITAMGYKLISTGPNNNYVSDNGTSMSTPNVTGGAVLLDERYRQLHNNHDPDNALIKLLLMNGADDLAQPGPDYHYGFGLMNLGHSLTMLDNNEYFSDSIQTGQQQTFSFQIPANIALAKVMLYWDDPAASPMSVQNLVNDLDLTVKNNSTTEVTYPLVLNPSASQVSVPATQGADHTNNVEQVTLQTPTSGSYTIQVKGNNIPEGPQKYYVGYSLIPTGIFFQYPFGGEALEAGDSVYIYWETADSTTSFNIFLSTDSGTTWQNVASNIAADQRAYFWHIPDSINSATCLLKITRGSEAAMDKPFMITGRPEITIANSATQCPGSIRFSWHPIAGISKYQILKKYGIGMQPVATTTDTTFTITGLSTDSTYWIAVASMVDNKIGIRSVAKSYQPNQGNCSAVAVHGDLRMIKIVRPASGRINTQSALSAASAFQIEMQNADNQSTSDFKISWKINNGSWQSQNFYQSIAASAYATLVLPTLNLADTGDYQLTVAVTNLAVSDPVTRNDTISEQIRQLPNDTLNLAQPFTDGFEGMPVFSETGNTVMGVGNSAHWDFQASHSYGRIRSFINSGVTISGNRSISLDNTINETGDTANSSQNYFTGTFNLSNYNANFDELRCTFEYLMSGVPKFDTGNDVWVRGNDNDPWLLLYKYQIDPNDLGKLYNSGSVSISNTLLQGGQNFSTATQIRFGQRDTSQIESTYYGNGLTMDNFSLYEVRNDMQLLAIDSLLHFNCALSNQVPLHIVLYNSVPNTVYNISVTFKLDNQTPVTETIDSIVGKDTITYTFLARMDLSALGRHTLSVWCSAPNDNYHLNDSILNYTIHNQPVIDTFPYLQDFESSNGGFYTEGKNSSWQYGTPNSPKITHAASGTKIWKTNLTGDYNNNETSYLYSPCFDISSLQNPTLSFSLATDIENNPTDTTIYDEAYLEYTTDGVNWQRLGAAGQGYNWYNNAHANAWTKEGETWWHVATIPLPRVNGTIAFRFVLKSDPGATFEGVAIDDIHIYDLENSIFTGDSLQTLTPHNIATNSSYTYMADNQLLATINNSGTALNNTTVQRYNHTYFINTDSSQYFLPESFFLKSDDAPDDSIEVDLYVLGDAMKKVRAAGNCPSCTITNEIYQMGVSQYVDSDKNKEDSSLTNDRTGQWNYIPAKRIRYIPYDKGYEAKFKIAKFSEIWFNSGGSNGNAPLNLKLFNFYANHLETRYAQLTWYSLTDEQTTHYFIQRSDATLNFQTIGEDTPVHQNGHVYTFVDTPVLYDSFVLYRIMYQNENGAFYFSATRMLNWSGANSNVIVYPNPVENGTIHMSWMKGDNNPLKWRFFDYSGRLIHSGQTEGNAYSDTQEIYLGRWGLSAGLYLMKVMTKERTWTFKIVYQP